jgi:hypothetical protein
MALQRQLTLTSEKRCILRIRAEDLWALEKHLFQRYPDREWGTFFRFGYRRTSWGLALSYVVPAHPGPGDMDRSQCLTRFTDQYSRRAFQDSATNPLGTGVAHSHPEGARTWPSSLDDDMDLYFAREFSSYSRGAPYCSIILQRSERSGLTFTGRVFDKGEWLSVESLISVGAVIDRYESELHFDTGRSFPPAGESITARLAAVMGASSVERLRGGVVGIVGTSGTGSPSAHVLARSQVGGFVLVDPQRFAPSNHERFHVSTNADLIQTPAPYKVELVRRLIESINPDAHVSTIAGNILHDNVLDELLTCDVVLGCTDTQHGRAALSDIASHYLLPSIDVGVLMDGAHGRVSTQLVDVTVYSPNLPCGFCAGRIDGVAMSHELLSETEFKEREIAAIAAAARGDDPDQYWRRRRQLHAVGYLTTLAGALAAGYIEGWLTGTFEPPHPSFQFDIGQQRFGVVAPPRVFVPGCSCQSHRGRADQAYAYRNVVRPPHWPRRGILLHQRSKPTRAKNLDTLNRRSN